MNERGDIFDCYRILEIEPHSALEEVKRSYRDLAKVWHPDRFAGDPKLQRRAQEKLKEINLAYEQICNQPSPAGDRTSAHAYAAPQEPPPNPAPSAKRNHASRLVQAGAGLGVIAAVLLAFGAADWWRALMAVSTPPRAPIKTASQTRKIAMPQPPAESSERVYSDAELVKIWEKILSPSNHEASPAAQPHQPKSNSTNEIASSAPGEIPGAGNEKTGPTISSIDKASVVHNEVSTGSTKVHGQAVASGNAAAPAMIQGEIAETKERAASAAKESGTKADPAPPREQLETLSSKADKNPVPISNFARNLAKLADARIGTENILLYALQNLPLQPVTGGEVSFLRRHEVPQAVILAVSAPRLSEETRGSSALLEINYGEPPAETEYQSGMNYLLGNRVRMDATAAYALFDRAAERGNKDAAAARWKLGQLLTHAELIAAKQRGQQLREGRIRWGAIK